MGSYGVLVISHGSRSKEWVGQVDDAVGGLHLPWPLPVECGFLELVEGRGIQDGIDRLEAQGVTDMIVVPLFISSGSTHIDEIGYALGVRETALLPTALKRFRIRAAVRFCRPMDDDPEVAEMICEKLRPISDRPSREAVLLIGHGSKEDGFCRKWQQGLERLAAKVRELGGYDDVCPATLLPDQVRERMAQWREWKPERDVLVAPLFLSEGYFTKRVIPARLEGFSYRYTGASLLPSPLVAQWMEKRIMAALPAEAKWQ